MQHDLLCGASARAEQNAGQEGAALRRGLFREAVTEVFLPGIAVGQPVPQQGAPQPPKKKKTGLIIGIIAGFIACKLTNREGKGCIIDLLLGIVGGAVGGWLFGILGIHAGAGIIGEIITAVVGAVVVLWLWNKLS